MLDVPGPLEVLYQVSRQYQQDFHLIAATLDRVTVRPAPPAMSKKNSSWFPEVLPPDTLASAPRELYVLLVPEGIGARSPELSAHVAFVVEMAAKVGYLMMVCICTGALIASNAGVGWEARDVEQECVGVGDAYE